MEEATNITTAVPEAAAVPQAAMPAHPAAAPVQPAAPPAIPPTTPPAEASAPVNVQSFPQPEAPVAVSHLSFMESSPDTLRLVQPMDDTQVDGAISSMKLNIHSINGRQIASKWTKTAVLRQDPRVARHIPDTRIYSLDALKSMLDAYGKVVLKPVVGSGGLGLIMITRSGGNYIAKHRHSTRRYGSFRALAAGVRRMRRRRRYLIQRGVSLATINGRPIDYRVKMVKKHKRWATTAMVGRLARQGLFVTNLCRGGTMLTAAEGIKRSLSPAIVKSKKGEMRQLTRMCIALLERTFPGVGELGFDYGIDHNGMIWIFEVNTRPH